MLLWDYHNKMYDKKSSEVIEETIHFSTLCATRPNIIKL